MANFSVKIGNKAGYLGLTKYDSSALYFCQDTREIFRGDALYTEPVRFVETFPTTPAQGVLYINTVTEEGKVYNGTEWKTVTKKFSTIVDANSTDDTVPTSKAVFTAVNAVATDVATIKGDASTEGSIAKALADAKAYADGKDEAIADAKAAGTTAQTQVGELQTLVGTLPEDTEATTVVEYAKALADEAKKVAQDGIYDDTKLKGLINDNKTAIETLNGTGDGSVSKQVADAVAQIVNEAPEAYDTLKEISDWISSHTESAASMNSSIIQNATDIDALEKLVGTLPEGVASETLVSYISEAISTAIAEQDLSKYALASDLTAAVTRIGTLETKVGALETLVGALPEDTEATTVVDYIDSKVAGSALEWTEF